MMELVIQHRQITDHGAISIEQYRKRREQRRRRVAKRMAKRFPLFAVEFMSGEFPDYDYSTFVEDVQRRSRPSKILRKVKSPLKLQGRYADLEKALNQYHLSKDQAFLEQAQTIRNRLFQPYVIAVRIKGGYIQTWTLRSTISRLVIVNLVEKVQQHGPFESIEQADQFFKQHTKYLSLS
jgi:hypothetical protein